MPANDPNSFEIVKFLWGVLLLPLGWLGIKVSRTEETLTKHQLYAANNFVKHNELQVMEDRILKAISELKADIKSKADK